MSFLEQIIDIQAFKDAAEALKAFGDEIKFQNALLSDILEEFKGLRTDINQLKRYITEE